MGDYIDVSYIIEFIHTDGEKEYYQHSVYNNAKEHYDIFDETDADIYTTIRLIEYNWVSKQSRKIEEKHLA